MPQHYSFTHRPDPMILRRDLRATSTVLPAPTFTDTCNAAARDCRRLAREAYNRGHQRTGDQLFARALAWELCRADGDLTPLER